MSLKFYVSHESKQMGPFSIDEIVDHVGRGVLSPLDYIYDEAVSDWVLFLEHKDLAERVKALKPKAPPRVHEEPVESKVKKPSYQGGSDREWFILKGENKFGPFTYTDVVKMLQQGVVYEFDFTWNESMGGWTRIAETPDFNKDNLRKLKESSMPEINEVFFRRRYRRVQYGGTILIHDNKRVWKGKGVEMSEGGVGVVMENAMVLPGQELFLHFKPGDGVPPFNALCEVVSKQYDHNVTNANAPVKYGLKFKSINAETQQTIKEYTKRAA
jgi:hypothetical protein